MKIWSVDRINRKEYNMINFFLRNHTQNVPDPFLKNEN